jgi:hypothetical protein
MRDIEELMVEARVVLDRQTELANECDDEVADYLSEGWEESAQYAKDKADDHWAAASVIRGLVDALNRHASRGHIFSSALQTSMDVRG